MQKTDRVALVTGASSGIGEATARILAREGFRVVLAARRGELLESIAKDISRQGGEALPVVTDLADDASTTSLVEAAMGAFGRIDVLVNNAGYSPGGAIEHFSRETIRHVFEVNLLAGLQLCGEIAPIMRRQGGGRIINVGSLGGSVAAPLAIPYNATKAGLDIATRALRFELAPWGIHVVLVVPGFIDTAVFENAREGAQDLRNDPENPYRQLFFDLDEFTMKSVAKALPPAAIGEVIARAATAKRPRLRYYAPFSAHLQSRFMSLIPESWMNAMLMRVYKISRPRGQPGGKRG
jgi:NAD(P)-dependent dehydrogenase (short-subunit alcohol dehydrogenase family)